MPQNIEKMYFTQCVDMMKSASFYFEYWKLHIEEKGTQGNMNETVNVVCKNSQFPSDYSNVSSAILLQV